jgi:hypothetical protein
MTTSLLTAAAFVLLIRAPVPKPADVNGAWAVTITTADGKITGEARLTQTGKKVTGQIGPAGDATIDIAGEINGNTLTLKTSPAPGRTAAFETCELTISDGKMAGTIHGGDVGKGAIEFVRKKP